MVLPVVINSSFEKVRNIFPQPVCYKQRNIFIFELGFAPVTIDLLSDT